jgi:hypothetical protein
MPATNSQEVCVTYTPDLRSPAWLEGSVRYARLGYRPGSELAKEAVAADAVYELMNMLMVSLSNRQLMETGRAAADWMKDLILCEEESELSPDLQRQKAAAQVLCDLCEQHRCARGTRRQ